MVTLSDLLRECEFYQKFDLLNENTIHQVYRIIKLNHASVTYTLIGIVYFF